MLSNHINKQTLELYSHIFTDETTTNQLEQDFYTYLVDHEISVYHDSGDIDLDALHDAFHEYMYNL